MRRSLSALLVVAVLAAGLWWRAAREAPAPAPSRDGREGAAAVSKVPNAAPSRIRLPAASPATERDTGTLAEFEGNSRGRWLMRRDQEGFVTRLAEAELPGESGASPEENSEALLRRYGKSVFGMDPASAGDRRVVRESDSSQVRIQQRLNGLPVLGTELNLLFNAQGALVYAVSTLYTGSDVPPAAADVPALAAATAARGALAAYYSGRGHELSSESHTPEALARGGTLAYRLSGGGVTLVYRYVLLLQAPLFGDLEVLVGAAYGGVVSVKELSRK